MGKLAEKNQPPKRHNLEKVDGLATFGKQSKLGSFCLRKETEVLRGGEPHPKKVRRTIKGEVSRTKRTYRRRSHQEEGEHKM